MGNDVEHSRHVNLILALFLTLAHLSVNVQYLKCKNPKLIDDDDDDDDNEGPKLVDHCSFVQSLLEVVYYKLFKETFKR